MKIEVKLISEGMFKNIRISKTYGNKWEKINEGHYAIRITQLRSEISRDFVF